MKTLSVIAAAGLKVPREENPRKYITDSSSTRVPASAYYRRRLRTGELVDPAEAASNAAASADSTTDSASRTTQVDTDGAVQAGTTRSKKGA